MLVVTRNNTFYDNTTVDSLLRRELGDFFIFRSLYFILTKFKIYAGRLLQELFWVKVCYLTEASTAEMAINSIQEIEKNYPQRLLDNHHVAVYNSSD